ncbi:hypothetical protein Tco_0269602 [Tanacetum coccineum]
MSTSYITISLDSGDESTALFVSYIIISNSEDEDTASPAALAPPSLDYVPASPNYAPGLETDTEPLEEDPKEAEHNPKESSEEDPSEEVPTKEDESLSVQDPPAPPTQTAPTIPTLIIQRGRIPSFRPYWHHPNGWRFMLTLRKTVCAPYTLSSSIEAAITKEIAAPPRKRTRSPSPSTLPSPPPLTSSSSPSSSSSPLPPPPRDTLPPRKRFKMTSPYPDTTDDVMVEIARPRRRSDAHRWEWVEPMFHDWGTKEGIPYRLEDHIDELLLDRLYAMQQQIDKFYPSTEADRQDRDAT